MWDIGYITIGDRPTQTGGGLLWVVVDSLSVVRILLFLRRFWGIIMDREEWLALYRRDLGIGNARQRTSKVAKRINQYWSMYRRTYWTDDHIAQFFALEDFIREYA